MKISVIIPVFNEQKDIENCLKSIFGQEYNDFEVIFVDDGSYDKTLEILAKYKTAGYDIKLLKQNHKGAGAARNLGAKKAEGEILVFVDADMSFDPPFLEKLTEPIRKGLVAGTFSKEEYVSNKDNIWSKCWNINKGLPVDRMHPRNYPDEQAVFRAILKVEFDRVGGFDLTGYIDDHTLAEKLGYLATEAKGAVFYHRNPDSLMEVFRQARWIGKSEFRKRKIKNENIMRLVSFVRYSMLFSLFFGISKALSHKLPHFLIFKLVYDLGIKISLVGSFFGEQRYK